MSSRHLRHPRHLRRILLVTAAGVLAAAATGTSSPAPADPADVLSPTATTQASDPPRLTPPAVPFADNAGLHRDPDGTLHVTWTSQQGDGRYTLGHTRVDLSGERWSVDTRLEDWTSLRPQTRVVPRTAGPSIVFSGLLPVSGSDYYMRGGLHHVVSDDAGRTWRLPQERLALSDPDHFDVATLDDGTPVVAVSNSRGLHWRVGPARAELGYKQERHVSVPGGAFNVSVAAARGQAWLAYSTLASDDEERGVFLQQVFPTPGPRRKAPGSEGHGAPVVPTALATSTTGQVFLAYCSGTLAAECRRVTLWNASTGRRATVPASGADAGSISIAAAPGGRMWVTWRSDYGRLSAVRTDREGRSFGPVTSRQMSTQWGSFAQSSSEGSRGFVDVLLNNGQGHHLLRVLPRLRVAGDPQRWPASRARSVVLTVTDAGEPVGGAVVGAEGRSCRTSREGRCTLRFPAGRARSISVGVSRPGYADARTTLRAVR